MADLETASDKLMIPGIGHVFYADVDTAALNVTQFKFGTESTYGEWTWLGDTSSENLIEFESDGGDVTYKRTWDRLKTGVVREDETITATINSVSIAREVFELAFPGGEYDEATQSYSVASGGSSQKALMVVMEDGQNVAAFRFPNTDIKGSLPTLDLEEYMELPLSAAILGSPTTQKFVQIFEPRTYAAASGGGA